jgi:hypothetical protein
MRLPAISGITRRAGDRSVRESLAMRRRSNGRNLSILAIAAGVWNDRNPP